MPKRDIVRDGRIQAPKKRTDRSYLRTPGAAPSAPEPEDTSEPGEDAAMSAPAMPVAAPVAAPAPVRSASVPTTGAARAIQQQGIRKRRELDIVALGQRDTSYAMHELRRIAIFAGMVFVTLIVLTFVLK